MLCVPRLCQLQCLTALRTPPWKALAMELFSWLQKSSSLMLVEQHSEAVLRRMNEWKGTSPSSNYHKVSQTIPAIFPLPSCHLGVSQLFLQKSLQNEAEDEGDNPTLNLQGGGKTHNTHLPQLSLCSSHFWSCFQKQSCLFTSSWSLP